MDARDGTRADDDRSAPSTSDASRARARWLGLALAQVCAFVNAVSAASSTALERAGATMPAWQTTFAYALVGTWYGGRFYARARDGKARGRDARRLGAYAACAFADVQANYFVTLAFRYTSMTSVSLLDSATIPFAMALSTAFLGARYARTHAGGAAIAFAGLAALVLGDASAEATGGGTNRALGDFLAICAAAMYATSNVLVEAFLRDADKVEILAHVGVMGFAISGAQCALLEGMKITQLKALGAKGVGFFATYALSLFVLYTFAMDVLERCGASAFNVSMLASDVWSVILRLIFFEGFASFSAVIAFGFAFLLVAGGICVFAYAGDPSIDPSSSSSSLEIAPDDDDVSFVARVRRFFIPDARARPYAPMPTDDARALDVDVELTPMRE